MGHGGFARQQHGDLAERLKRGPVALAEPNDARARKAWREIIEILFSPEDASLAARLPVLPATLETIADRTGMNAETLRDRLGGMADRGLVLDIRDRRTGTTRYMLAPPMVGFFEFSMMRLSDGLPKARLARAYEAYIDGDSAFLEEISVAATLVGRTLVHETAGVDDLVPEVLDWERASACVQSAKHLSVTNCFCRHIAEHLGTRCDYPMETCMSLGGGAEYLVRHNLGREITNEQGLELLAAARESGLVHIADNVQQNVSYICSCCACCCHELRSVQVGLPVVQPSGLQPAIDHGQCTGCGRCVRACPVQALSLVPRDPRVREAQTPQRLLSHVDLDRCLGCGVCTGACREHALRMERRPQPPYVPLNAIDRLTRRMLERGRLADLLIDGTAGRGPAFANAVLGAIAAFPAVDKLLASEQVKSRFVRQALSKGR
jgi:formate hydrogenlyase subunit 6/NADH:ubiquinone oxidoreductase subunit I